MLAFRCEPYQPLLFIVKGVNEAAKDIRTFASDRSKQLAHLSQWDVMVSCLGELYKIDILFLF